jgi:hypothetical protein
MRADQMHAPRRRHVASRVIWAAVSLLGTICLTVGAAAAPTEPASQATLWSRPSVPIEGTEVVLTLRVPAADGGASAARMRILDSQGEVILDEAGSLVRHDEGMEWSMSWRPAKNGIYQVEGSYGSKAPVRLDVPVLIAERALDFVWYRYEPWLRWPTVITSANDADLPRLRNRGIRALRWMYGSNHPVAAKEGRPAEAFEAEAEQYYRVPEGFAFDGYGIDEFGGYPQTETEARGLAWLRGLRDARREFPKGFVVAAWHGGGVRDTWVGLYKQAADLLLLEAYDMYYVPHELGTENIYADLRGRLIAPRAADLFTRAYGSPCKVLLALDLCGGRETYGDAGELEQVIRWIRREAPEMRGIAFFNGSDASEAVERAADRLCFEYFVRPVVTFEPESLWLDRSSGHSQVVAAISNIGGVDSGPVMVRLKLDGEVVGTARLVRVPAGSSRLTNRAFVRWEWQSRPSGLYELQAEIAEAPGSTVLDGSVSEKRWIAEQ